MPELRDRIRYHVEVLATEIGARPPGSPANRRATAHVRAALEQAGLEVAEARFSTRWWEPGEGRLEVAGRRFEVSPNPYSPAGEVQGRAVPVAGIEELEALGHAPGTIIVLTEALAREQVMPAAFPFLDVPEHARIRDALQHLDPAAVIAVSDHWEPILEDPEFAFPSTTVPTDLGGRLHPGSELRLAVAGAVHTGDGSTVSARWGRGDDRIVLCAHLDSKSTTPGAFDNAASVATILALSETGRLPDVPIEIVLFNGEDHFDACGEVAWLAATDLDRITGVLNLDGVGLAGRRTSLATLSCPENVGTTLQAWVEERPAWVPAAPWFESDHAIFAMRGIPAVAVTTEDVHALLGGLAHTDADTVEVLDLAILEDIGHELPDLLRRLHWQLLTRS